MATGTLDVRASERVVAPDSPWHRGALGFLPSIGLHGIALAALLIGLTVGEPGGIPDGHQTAPQVAYVTLGTVAEAHAAAVAPLPPSGLRIARPPALPDPSPAVPLPSMATMSEPSDISDVVPFSAWAAPRREEKLGVAAPAVTQAAPDAPSPEKAVTVKAETAKPKPAGQKATKPKAKPTEKTVTKAAAAKPSAPSPSAPSSAGPSSSMPATANPASIVNAAAGGVPARHASAGAVSDSAAVQSTKDNPVVITDPNYAGACPIKYPERARRRNQQGTVVIRTVIDTEGHAASVDVIRSSGHGALDEAAADGIARCAFAPQRVNGRPVRAIGEIPIPFKLI
jgi:protein TonB